VPDDTSTPHVNEAYQGGRFLPAKEPSVKKT
jgi:hypothetical protein